MKELKFSPYKENFYLSIINYIKRYKKLPSIRSKNFNIPPKWNIDNFDQNIQYYLKKLKTDGIVYKKGYSVWDVNEDKADQFKFIEKVKKTPKVSTKHLDKIFSSSKDIRGHGFIISFIIPKIAGWHKRKDYLNKLGFNPIDVGIRKSGQRIIFKGHKIHLYNKKIIIYSPKKMSYFASSAEESYKYAIYDLIELVKSLERKLGISISHKGQYKFKVDRQHYGKVNSYLSRMYKRDGERLYVANEGGVWLTVDYSLGSVPEEETVSKTSKEDMDDVLKEFYNSLKAQKQSTGEPFRVDKLMEMQFSTFKTQQAISRNIEDLTNTLKKVIERLER